MLEKVQAYIDEYRILNTGDRVLVGLSGGPDSVCLLDILLRLADQYQLRVAAVHLNHGLRAEAGDDEAFVKALCRERQVALETVHADVAEYAAAHKLSAEEAGRDLRRRCYAAAGRKFACSKVALGHHMNDNAETLLLNLARGSSLKGLGGMGPVAGAYIRPLLCVERAEIEAYLAKRQLAYCTDATNATDAYTRNQIRHHVLPYLTEHINIRSVSHISEAMAKLREAEQYLEQEAEKITAAARQADESYLLRREVFAELPALLARQAIHQMLSRLAGQQKDIGAVHLQLVSDLFGRQVGRRLQLPYGLQAARVYAGVRLFRPAAVCSTVAAGADIHPDDSAGPRATTRILPPETDWRKFPTSLYTKWFDYDIIKHKIEIRHRRARDFIMVNARGGRKSLKKFFIDEKVPQAERDRIWLVCDGPEVLWVVGYRQSPAYQVSDQTKQILEITFAEEEHGNNKSTDF